MTKREARIIVANFIYNDYLLNVHNGGGVPPTEKRISFFLEARDILSIDEYRKISADETTRFKKQYDL